jgi:hypothetical protein
MPDVRIGIVSRCHGQCGLLPASWLAKCEGTVLVSRVVPRCEDVKCVIISLLQFYLGDAIGSQAHGTFHVYVPDLGSQLLGVPMQKDTNTMLEPVRHVYLVRTH